jgi:hypothetical protein
MRASDKGMMAQITGNRLFGTDFHDRIEHDAQADGMEFGSEFGLTSRDVRSVKKRLERS